MLIKKTLIKALAFAIVLAVVMLGRIAYNFLDHNKHVVIPNQIYRTAQLNHAEWLQYLTDHHITSVINLRGDWPDNHWYRVEKRFAQKHHLHYYSIRLQAYQLPPKKTLQELVNMLLIIKKPLVFHCEGGADRTGMASAISVILFNPDADVDDVKDQVSWYYNAISPRTVGYQMLQNYFAWLKQTHNTFSRKTFLQWVRLPDKMQPYYGWFW